jgi:hypothetical protein
MLAVSKRLVLDSLRAEMAVLGPRQLRRQKSP